MIACREEISDFRIAGTYYLTKPKNEICKEMGNYDPYLGGKSTQSNNIQDLKDLNQFNVTDICKTEHSITAECLYFLSAHGR